MALPSRWVLRWLANSWKHKDKLDQRLEPGISNHNNPFHSLLLALPRIRKTSKEKQNSIEDNKS
jgi:hypothetical protein